MARKTASKSQGPAGANLGADTRVCVLHGSEEMLKRNCLERLRQAMEAAHGQVETTLYDGRTAQLADVLDELRSFGLMQQYKLVVVDEAETFVSTHREALERYAQGPVDTATLVLRSTQWRAGNLDKHIAKVGCVIKCEALNEGDVRDWVMQRSQEQHQRKISPAAAALLVERLGVDLMRLDSELSKLALLVEPGQTIEPKLVGELVGRSSEEAAWAIQEEILGVLAGGETRTAGNGAGPVIEKLHEIIDLAGQSEVVVSYAIADLVRKLHLAVRMKREGAHDMAIAKELKMWGPRQEMLGKVLRRMNGAVAERLFDRILELDRRAKTGFGDPVRNLEGFCAEMVGAMGVMSA